MKAIMILMATLLLAGCTITREQIEYAVDGKTPVKVLKEKFPFGYGTDGNGHVYPSDNAVQAGERVLGALVEKAPEVAGAVAGRAMDAVASHEAAK